MARPMLFRLDLGDPGLPGELPPNKNVYIYIYIYIYIYRERERREIDIAGDAYLHGGAPPGSCENHAKPDETDEIRELLTCTAVAYRALRAPCCSFVGFSELGLHRFVCGGCTYPDSPLFCRKAPMHNQPSQQQSRPTSSGHGASSSRSLPLSGAFLVVKAFGIRVEESRASDLLSVQLSGIGR